MLMLEYIENRSLDTFVYGLVDHYYFTLLSIILIYGLLDAVATCATLIAPALLTIITFVTGKRISLMINFMHFLISQSIALRILIKLTLALKICMQCSCTVNSRMH